MSIIHVVSCSTGKDSVATLALAVARFGASRVRGILCDTGNEHEHVFQHRLYLEKVTGVRIDILKANFDAEIAAKRLFIARDKRWRREYDTKPVFEADGKTPVPKRDGRGNIVVKRTQRDGVELITQVQKTVKVGGGRRVRWSNKAKRRALAALHPTGIPFLDLCMWKGRFPSRKAQFCTEHLKRDLAVSYQLDLIAQGYTVVSWQGVRRDESLNRRNARKFERLDDRMYVFRPLVDWTAEQVFDYAAQQGIEPNPLYKCGMGRVGCMPCINAGKGEIKEIALRFPDHIEKIAEWEQKVAACSKRQAATFFPAPSRGEVIDDKKAYAEGNNIYSVVQWSKTSRGGRQFSLLDSLSAANDCSSSYGLCG
jgi:3'-phosphoadenosine 5'-phosphosulfate sulfotransferase (PAPS reductase)/FAD synthetase